MHAYVRMYVKGNIGIIIFLYAYIICPRFLLFLCVFSATLVVKSLINIRCIYIIVYNICIYIITYIREREEERKIERGKGIRE